MNKGLSVPLAALIGLTALVTPAAAARTVVDCRLGQTITAALQAASKLNPIIIVIKGRCKESVHITRNDVTLEASWDGVTIIGKDPAVGTVTIDGAQRVLLEGLTISGPSDGVVLIGNASATLLRVLAENNTGRGVRIGDSSTATIDASILRNNGSDGVASRGSTFNLINSQMLNNGGWGVALADGTNARIGVRNTDLTLAGNVIRLNGLDGILVANGSIGFIFANTISDNVRDGINGSLGAVRLGTRNLIERNGRNGISLVAATLLQAFPVSVPAFPWTPQPDIIADNTGNGINASVGSNADLTLARIVSNRQWGLAIHQGSQFRTSGEVVVENNTNFGVRLHGGGLAAFTGTAIRTNGSDGVNADFHAKVELWGASVHGNAGNGVRLQRSSGLVTDSVAAVTGNGGWGILCSGRSYADTGNVFSSNGAGDRSCLGFSEDE